MPKGGQARADMLYGLVMAAAALAMFVHTFSDRYDNEFLFGDVSTVFFPRLLLGTIVTLALALALKGAKSNSEEEFLIVNLGRVAMTYGAAVLAALGVWYIGYLYAMPFGVFLVGLALGYPNKLVLAGVSIVAPLTIWVVLAQFAQVSFPTGTLF